MRTIPETNCIYPGKLCTVGFILANPIWHFIPILIRILRH